MRRSIDESLVPDEFYEHEDPETSSAINTSVVKATSNRSGGKGIRGGSLRS